jgi:hypothetical protein
LRALRQALFAVSGAAVFAAVLRVRGKGGTPPQDSGWREVTPSELR